MILTNKRILFLIMPLLIGLGFTQCSQQAGLKALVVTETDTSGKSLKAILENSGLFSVDISKNASPAFSKYDVVVVNAASVNWNQEAKTSLADYLNNGGGVVLLGNSAIALSDAPGVAQVTGIGAQINAKVSTEAFEYQVLHISTDHPILTGLQARWMHTQDLLQLNTGSLDDKMEILATSWADTTKGGDGRSVPVLATSQVENGRLVVSTLASGATENNQLPQQCVGYITLVQRAVEWAATGVVSLAVPIDFPNSVSTHDWPEFRPLTIDELLQRASTYEIGKSSRYLNDISMLIRNSDGTPDSYAKFESKILDFLQSGAAIDSKKYMCRELSWVGSEKSVAVLEKLSSDKDLSESASYALQRLRM